MSKVHRISHGHWMRHVRATTHQGQTRRNVPGAI
jgi:hypothetical protein